MYLFTWVEEWGGGGKRRTQTRREVKSERIDAICMFLFNSYLLALIISISPAVLREL